MSLKRPRLEKEVWCKRCGKLHNFQQRCKLFGGTLDFFPKRKVDGLLH